MASGKLALLLAIPPGYATAVWPPAGVALAALVIYGYRLWPGILIGSFLVNIGTSYDATNTYTILKSVAVAGGIGVGASLQGLLGAFLIRRFVGFPLDLVREVEITKFLLLGGPLACTLNATLSVALLWAAGAIEGAHYAFNWWTWWVGDTIGVTVMAPFLLVWIGEPRSVWRKRLVPVALPMAATFLIVTAFFVRASAWEEARISFEFGSRARTLASAVERKFDDTLEVLNSVGTFYGAVPEVRRNMFQVFSNRTLARHRGISAISWNPYIPENRRATFEEAARGEGIPDFRIKERASDGRLVPAGERSEYVVVHYIEPYEGNENAVGLDVFSEPVRREALRRARDSERAAATARIQLVQDRRLQPGILVFLPVYRDLSADAGVEERRSKLVGYATGVLRPHEIVEAALEGLERSGIEISVWDEGRAAADQFLYTDAAGVAEATIQSWLKHRTSFDVGGRQWFLECRSTPVYLAVAGSWRAWTVLATGLLFTGILGAFLLAMTGRTVVIERLGLERAAELSKSNTVLEREIAERKAAEAALSQKENELRQAQKMEAVGRLAGGVAHDFNNLLTPILGYGQIVETSLEPDDPRRADVKEIIMAAERAAGLTRQLLVFSRKNVVQPQTLDLNMVLAEMQKLLMRVIREDIEMENVLRAGMWSVCGDRGQIEQVLMNLVVNARDAMPQGGKLTIETMNVTLDEDFAKRHHGIQAGEHVMLAVTDTGTGMSPEVREHLFEPFFTTKEAGKGTGLGLSTVYGIVQQSGGYISVYSEVGRGTSFIIYLPRAKESPQAEAAERNRPRSLGGTEGILVVEDNDGVRRLASTILRGYGYIVFEASHGEEALSLLRAGAVAIRLMITDVVMPKIGGVELVRQLKDLGVKVKILYMSGYPEGAAISQGILREDTPFLHKPFTPTNLLRKVRETLDGSNVISTVKSSK